MINNLGQLTPTRLTESVQVRVYHAISPGTKYMNYINGPSSADQDFFEFRMSREQLVMGHNGGLTAVAPDEKEFPTFNTHGFDPFDESSPQKEEGVGTEGVVQLAILILAFILYRAGCSGCDDCRAMMSPRPTQRTHCCGKRM